MVLKKEEAKGSSMCGGGALDLTFESSSLLMLLGNQETC